jgi:hypothetical protein
MSRLILRIEVFPSLRPPPRGILYTAQHENYLKTIFPIRSIKVSPLYPKQLYRSVQYGATAPKSITTVCPVHNFPPPSELLVCYQPHRQTVMPCQKSIYETFLGMLPYRGGEEPSHGKQLFLEHMCKIGLTLSLTGS